jgi:hypothetical protein
MLERRPEVDADVICSLECGELAKVFIGYNLDNYERCLPLCELEGD